MEITNKTCHNCGEVLDKVVFTHEMSEEWKWNGSSWECIGRNSLIDDPHLEVHCPECDTIVGTGKEFGF
jgi:phage FluMu protein Com